MSEIGGVHDTRIMRENIAVGIWLAILVTGGCLVLHAFAESARHECLKRGSAICSNIFQARASWSQQRGQAEKQHAEIAVYLKSSRRWR
jgi:hypothetical protein